MGFTQIKPKTQPYCKMYCLVIGSLLLGAESAKSLVLLWLSLRLDQITDLSAPMTGTSQSHCFAANVLSGRGRTWVEDQCGMAESTARSDRGEDIPRSSDWRVHVLAADAKKVEGASEAMRRIPSPPALTGR